MFPCWNLTRVPDIHQNILICAEDSPWAIINSASVSHDLSFCTRKKWIQSFSSGLRLSSRSVPREQAGPADRTYTCLLLELVVVLSLPSALEPRCLECLERRSEPRPSWRRRAALCPVANLRPRSRPREREARNLIFGVFCLYVYLWNSEPRLNVWEHQRRRLCLLTSQNGGRVKKRLIICTINNFSSVWNTQDSRKLLSFAISVRLLEATWNTTTMQYHL